MTANHNGTNGYLMGLAVSSQNVCTNILLYILTNSNYYDDQ